MQGASYKWAHIRAHVTLIICMHFPATYRPEEAPRCNALRRLLIRGRGIYMTTGRTVRDETCVSRRRVGSLSSSRLGSYYGYRSCIICTTKFFSFIHHDLIMTVHEPTNGIQVTALLFGVLFGVLFGATATTHYTPITPAPLGLGGWWSVSSNNVTTTKVTNSIKRKVRMDFASRSLREKKQSPHATLLVLITTTTSGTLRGTQAVNRSSVPPSTPSSSYYFY
eukprot:1195150-Prorocentrum_minimum.AAC.2